ncbi:MAG: hypothetical protein WD010_01990, partial [Nitriliruptor sp.]
MSRTTNPAGRPGADFERPLKVPYAAIGPRCPRATDRGPATTRPHREGDRMKVIVPVKRVPDTAGEKKIDDGTMTVD